jgi:hypothetical protein
VKVLEECISYAHHGHSERQLFRLFRIHAFLLRQPTRSHLDYWTIIELLPSAPGAVTTV